MTEIEVRHIAKQLFSTLEYLHEQNIAHSDIKLENIYISNKIDLGDSARSKYHLIKLLDFGLAHDVTKVQSFERESYYYQPPEIINK